MKKENTNNKQSGDDKPEIVVLNALRLTAQGIRQGKKTNLAIPAAKWEEHFEREIVKQSK